MKKAFVTLQLIFGVIIIVGALNDSIPTERTLSGSNWKFKSLACESSSTQDYLSSLYDNCQYRFSDDHTFTGTFFGLAVSGTWETTNDTLILNKGTIKEEVYHFVLPSAGSLILKGTEKGNQILIEFIKE